MLISETLIDKIAQRRPKRWHFFCFICDILYVTCDDPPTKQTTDKLKSYTIYDRILSYTHSFIVLLFPAADSRFNWVPVKSNNCPISHLSKVEQRELKCIVFPPKQRDSNRIEEENSCHNLFRALHVRPCSHPERLDLGICLFSHIEKYNGADGSALGSNAVTFLVFSFQKSVPGLLNPPNHMGRLTGLCLQ